MLALLVVCCIIIYGMVMIFLPRNYHTQLEGQGHGGFLRPCGALRAERLGGQFGQSVGILHDEQRFGGDQR